MTRWTRAGIVFALLNAVDALLTVRYIAHGYGEVHEANPLMAFLVAQTGLWGFAAVKVAIGSLLAVWMVRRRSWTLWVGLALVGGAVAWNCHWVVRALTYR